MIISPDISPIALDLDGVLFDWVGGICERAKQRRVPGVPHDPSWVREWEFFDPGAWPLLFDSPADYDGFMGSLSPIEPAEQMRFVPIGYVTHRAVSEDITRSALCDHGFPPAPLYSVPKTEDKTEQLKRIGAEIFVDDKPSIVAACRREGIEAYLFDRSYNRGADLPRIYSLTELTHATVSRR